MRWEIDLDSTQLSEVYTTFSGWYPFNEKVVQNVPKQKGIYVLRKARGRPFGRLRGQSDLMYIGSTEAQGGLKQRMRQYWHPGPTQWTNKRIKGISKKHEMEVAWCLCDEPGNLEHELLHKYLKGHDELPPLNHATKRLLRKLLKEGLHIIDRRTSTKS